MTTRLRSARTTTAQSTITPTDADKIDKTTDVTRWQPLTLAALMDYKSSVPAPRKGQFALGQVRLWPLRQ